VGGMRYASDGKVYFGSSTQSAHDGACSSSMILSAGKSRCWPMT